MYFFRYTAPMPTLPISITLSVRFYVSGQGNEPVRDWLKSLRAEDRKAIGEDIKTVQYGWPLGMPLVRKMEAGLWEVRSHISDGIARVLFTTVGATMVLLHGFVKKSDKTPKADLKLAQQRKQEVHDD
ncbi:type II toxin-antitoxin system RelE/ParE family toxin [Dyella sp. M7H15-1]|nr:type II toxin-antitoxin system RelE/ParE family toxin [Dyella sp. M7H15-1]